MIKLFFLAAILTLSPLMAMDQMNIDTQQMSETERFLPYMQYEAFKTRYAQHIENLDRTMRTQYLWNKRHDRCYSDFLFPLLESAQAGYSVAQKAIRSFFKIDTEKCLQAQTPTNPESSFFKTINELIFQYGEMSSLFQLLEDLKTYSTGFKKPFYGSQSLSDHTISTISNHVKDILNLLIELKNPGKVVTCITPQMGSTRIPMISLDFPQYETNHYPYSKLYSSYMLTKETKGILILLTPNANKIVSHLYKNDESKNEYHYTFGPLRGKFGQAQQDLKNLEKKLSDAKTPEIFKMALKIHLSDRTLKPSESYVDDLLSQYQKGLFEFNIDNILEFINQKLQTIDEYEEKLKQLPTQLDQLFQDPEFQNWNNAIFLEKNSWLINQS